MDQTKMCYLHQFFLVCQLLFVQGISSGPENHNEFTIYTAIEQSLLNDTTGELFRLREVFFPSSSKYQFWKADGLQTIQFNACLNLTDMKCKNTKELQSVFAKNTTITMCWALQWTNSYLLGLLGPHQLYQFEPLLTALIYLQTVGHREVNFNVKLNLTDPILCSIKEEDLEKYFTSFITWTKAYAATQGKPTSWSADVQGYVARKYNTYTKGLYDNLNLEDKINYTILVCFISSNLLLAFLLVSYGGWLYRKVSSITNGTSTIKKNACRGVLLVTSFLLVPIYLIGLFIGHAGGVYPKYYPPCSKTVIYNCEPPHSSIVYILEIASFYSKAVILVVVLLLYIVSSILVVAKAASPNILFQNLFSCYRCVETFVWWSALSGIHICFGLAGVPILLFLLITPIYTFFFVFSVGLIIILLSLPVVLCLHRCRPDALPPHHSRADCRRICSLRFTRTLIAYLLTASLTVALLYLYYGLLTGGASMNGTKGILFSLTPPALIAVCGFSIRYRYFTSSNKAVAHDSTDALHIINNTDNV